MKCPSSSSISHIINSMSMDVLAGFLVGLAGSMHCAGMCGPIAMALPGGTAHGMTFVLGRMGYLAGRVVTYAIIGAAVGAGVGAVTLSGYETVLSLTAGGLMILTALGQILWHRSILPQAPVMKITAPVRTGLQKMMRRHSVAALTGIGLLNGLLPCGLVLSAVFGSATQSDPLNGAMFMVAFGLGTLPMMGALALGGTVIFKRLGSYRQIMPIVALLLGMMILVRGMNLGIPYISPKAPVANHHAACCSQSP